MSHSTEIIEYKKLSNGQFAVRIRCCGNESTDHWHTMVFLHDPVERAANLEKIKQLVADQHEAARQTESEFIGKMGEVTKHQ